MLKNILKIVCLIILTALSVFYVADISFSNLENLNWLENGFETVIVPVALMICILLLSIVICITDNKIDKIKNKPKYYIIEYKEGECTKIKQCVIKAKNADEAIKRFFKYNNELSCIPLTIQVLTVVVKETK